jgi:hypothetical protein
VKTTPNSRYECRVCHVKYSTILMRDACEKSHETVLITLYREDLYKLLNFIMTKDDSWLSERLMKTLQKYRSGFYTS